MLLKQVSTLSLKGEEGKSSVSTLTQWHVYRERTKGWRQIMFYKVRTKWSKQRRHVGLRFLEFNWFLFLKYKMGVFSGYFSIWWYNLQRCERTLLENLHVNRNQFYLINASQSGNEYAYEYAFKENILQWIQQTLPKYSILNQACEYLINIQVRNKAKWTRNHY